LLQGPSSNIGVSYKRTLVPIIEMPQFRYPRFGGDVNEAPGMLDGKDMKVFVMIHSGLR
jgi:hypothetical protein